MNIITSFSDLKKITKEFQDKRLEGFQQGKLKVEYFRGLGKENYELKSYLSRFAGNVSDLKRIEKECLEEFKNGTHKIDPEFLRNSPPNHNFFSSWELMWQAQEAGLPTRLMDWSLAIETACFFAIMNKDNDDSDGQLYVFTCPSSIPDHSEYLDNNPENFLPKWLINPAFNQNNDPEKQISELKRSIQDGRFLFQNYSDSLIALENQPELENDLYKYIIPKEHKEKIRNELASEGYIESTVLPSTSVSRKIDELIKKIIKEKCR